MISGYEPQPRHTPCSSGASRVTDAAVHLTHRMDPKRKTSPCSSGASRVTNAVVHLTHRMQAGRGSRRCYGTQVPVSRVPA
ncbi:hypothetical protein SAMN05216510_0020 [Pseudomonas coleopterorum]|nr:hypothetical protein SAMN05216510_0020 [Pseudomonas coleopterorum]